MIIFFLLKCFNKCCPSLLHLEEIEEVNEQSDEIFNGEEQNVAGQQMQMVILR
jgi:hypothetical protein